jgi:hypothetical protein
MIAGRQAGTKHRCSIGEFRSDVITVFELILLKYLPTLEVVLRTVHVYSTTRAMSLVPFDKANAAYLLDRRPNIEADCRSRIGAASHVGVTSLRRACDPLMQSTWHDGAARLPDLLALLEFRAREWKLGERLAASYYSSLRPTACLLLRSIQMVNNTREKK